MHAYYYRNIYGNPCVFNEKEPELVYEILVSVNISNSAKHVVDNLHFSKLSSYFMTDVMTADDCYKP